MYIYIYIALIILLPLNFLMPLGACSTPNLSKYIATSFLT